MEPSRAASLSRRGFLGVAAGLAGCASPVGAPTARGQEQPTFSPSVRRTAEAVGRRARRAVVVLQPPGSATSGTGWFLDGGHLVTNAHVVDELGADQLVGHTLDGTRFDVGIRRRVNRPDLALLSASIDPPATLAPGRSTALRPDQPLVQIGHTRLGYWTVALGRFERRRRFEGRTWVLTEMPMILGNSGSPIVTLDDRVVGLTFGSVPRPGTGPSRAPKPAPPTVYETYPRRRVEFGGHLAIETVRRYVERWTDG